jgi:DNA-binding NarL/FixJ family response regulator
MPATLQMRKTEQRLEARAWRQLPPRMRVLYITTHERTGAWLTEALEADSAVEVEIVEALGTASGMAQLRDEAFDVVLVSHLPGELDALDLIEGYRAGGADEPILVLGTQSEQEIAALCFEVGADGYLCVHTATTRNLLWTLARAVQRHQLLRENHRLGLAEQSRLQREHDEAEKLISQQRALVGDLEAMRDGAACENSAPLHLPEELFTHYRELLRTYVIMGSGNLVGELKRLAELLVSAGLSAQKTMQLHLRVVEELVNGLGARSSRHVMTRADLLGLEIMVHLAEGYRHRYEEKIHPPRQQILPGF